MKKTKTSAPVKHAAKYLSRPWSEKWKKENAGTVEEESRGRGQPPSGNGRMVVWIEFGTRLALLEASVQHGMRVGQIIDTLVGMAKAEGIFDAIKAVHRKKA